MWYYLFSIGRLDLSLFAIDLNHLSVDPASIGIFSPHMGPHDYVNFGPLQWRFERLMNRLEEFLKRLDDLLNKAFAFPSKSVAKPTRRIRDHSSHRRSATLCSKKLTISPTRTQLGGGWSVEQQRFNVGGGRDHISLSLSDLPHRRRGRRSSRGRELPRRMQKRGSGERDGDVKSVCRGRRWWGWWGGVRGAAMAGPRLDLCGAPCNSPPTNTNHMYMRMGHTACSRADRMQVGRYRRILIKINFVNIDIGLVCILLC